MIVNELEFNGLKFLVRPDTTDERIVNEVFTVYNRWFDVEPEEYWFDFGAHIGSFSVYALSKGAFVTAFEPVPENYELLLSNISNNSFENRVVVYPYAVMAEEKDIEMVITPYNYGACSTVMWTENSKITVQALAAKDLCKLFSPGCCIKMDIEGAEIEVLPDLPLEKISKLVMEFHHWLLPKNSEVFVSKLLKKNFSNTVFDKTTDAWYCWK